MTLDHGLCCPHVVDAVAIHSSMHILFIHRIYIYCNRKVQGVLRCSHASALFRLQELAVQIALLLNEIPLERPASDDWTGLVP